MLAAATMELRLVIPTWGDALLMAVGSGYLVVGGRWPRLFDVFSMTVIGCVVGLVVGNWVPLHPAIVISAAGIVVGGLAALFRNVGHAVLTGIVLAAAFSVLAAMAVGADGFASYLVTDVSAKSYAMRIYAPNLANDAVLAGALVGLLIGAAIAVLRFSYGRLATSARGRPWCSWARPN